MCKARGVVGACMLALTLAWTAGCNMYETSKANQLVDAANASIKDANERTEKGTNQLQALEAAVPAIEDEQALEKWRGEAKAIIAELEKARDGYTDAGNKFTEASKLKLQDKFKEYLDVKGREMKKRGEMADALIAEPRALIDSKTQDDYQKQADAAITKVKDLQKEANDLEGQADKIYEENKAMFRQS
jgi:hypothetical protein